MYFEELYNKIRSLWKDSFSLKDINETETYVKDIAHNWDEISNITHFLENKKYTEWHRMLDFTMYQALTAFALNKWKSEKAEVMYFDEIPITLFEEYFRKNLQADGNEEYLKKYKGFRKKQ